MSILAIDPGNTYSAFVHIADDYKPIEFGKVPNEELRDMLIKNKFYDAQTNIIEMVASYGMAVGKEVFDTCVWIGRYIELTNHGPYHSELVFRKDVKLNLCGQARAKDANIIQALKDRFGDKGTKAAPGFFYGFKADCWQAFAVGVTYLDKKKEGKANAS